MENNPVSGKSEKRRGEAAGKAVGATVATLAVIRQACLASGPFRLAEVARATGLNRSTAFNILKTLLQEGLVDFDSASKTYVLTDYLPRLVRGLDDAPSDRARALHQGMARIAELFDVSIAHWIVRGDTLVLAAVAESNAEFRLTQAEGMTVPLLYGAAGRAVAAALAPSDEELVRLMAALGDGSAEALASLKADLRRAQRRGWADDGGSLRPGVKAVGVALHDGKGSVEGACAALLLNGQFDARGEEAIVTALLKIASSK